MSDLLFISQSIHAAILPSPAYHPPAQNQAPLSVWVQCVGRSKPILGSVTRGMATAPPGCVKSFQRMAELSNTLHPRPATLPAAL